jgi:hypothetical protein
MRGTIVGASTYGFLGDRKRLRNISVIASNLLEEAVDRRVGLTNRCPRCSESRREPRS